MNAPRGLRQSGKHLWKTVTATLRLDDARLERLRHICVLEDEVDRMRKELERSPLMVTGSTGQPVVNPLVEQVRSHGQLIIKHLQQLTEGVPLVASAREPPNALERLRMEHLMLQMRAQAGLVEYKGLEWGCPSCSMELAELYDTDPGQCPRCGARLPAGYPGSSWPKAPGVWQRLPDGSYTGMRSSSQDGA
jgi:hypothetical protein